jgi:hypothetical protein
VVGNDVGGGDSFGGRFFRMRTGLAVRSSGPGVPAGERALVGCRSPLRRGRGGMRVPGALAGGSFRTGRSRQKGVKTSPRLAPARGSPG